MVMAVGVVDVVAEAIGEVKAIGAVEAKAAGVIDVVAVAVRVSEAIAAVVLV